MITWIKARILRGFLGGLARSNDTRTTVLGVVAASLLAAQLDWAKLLQGDPDQLGLAAGAAVAALFGYWTNKHDRSQGASK